MVTMLLGGLWHGAGWTFVIWGGLHGCYLVINHLWQTLTAERLSPLPDGWSWLGRLSGLCLTFLCVVVAWVFFRAESLSAAMTMLDAMVGNNGLGKQDDYFRGASETNFLLLSALVVWCAPNVQEILQKFRPALETYDHQRPEPRFLLWQPNGRWAFFTGLLGAIAVMNMTGVSEFLYFQF